MTTIGEKVVYVKSQKRTRYHECHWPGCKMQVPPAMWGCRVHWYQLPQAIRARIWSTYKPGQEIKLNPSRAYVLAAIEAQEWIAEYLKGK